MKYAQVGCTQERGEQEFEVGWASRYPWCEYVLWREKVDGPKEASDRDFEPSEDICTTPLFNLLSLIRGWELTCRSSVVFLRPSRLSAQRNGTLLLQWGLNKEDELKAKIWLTSTPQAVDTYERSGWKVVERYDIVWG